MRKYLIALGFCAIAALVTPLFSTLGIAPTPAYATNPYCQFAYGEVWTAGQWNACLDSKQDNLNFTPVNRAGDVMAGSLTMALADVTAGLNIPEGAPSAPIDGDVWTQTTGLYIHVNGSTVGPLGTTLPGGSNTQIQYNNAGTFGGLSDVTGDGTSMIFADSGLKLSGGVVLNGVGGGGGGGTLTLPPGTDTLLGVNSVASPTHKTYDTAATGNVLKINGNTVSAYTGTGNTIVLSASPAFSGTLGGSNFVALSNIAQQSADTVLGNFTGSTANVGTATLPSCSTVSSALTYNTGTHGFGCNAIGGISSIVSSPLSLTSTTPVDSGLSISLAASQTYNITLWFTYTSTNPTKGPQAQTAGTATFSSFAGFCELINSGGTIQAVATITTNGALFNSTGTSATSTYVTCRFVAVTSGSGTLKIQVANNSGTTGTFNVGVLTASQ